MARMKRFLTYFLCLVGFIILSRILENGLLENMYVKMGGQVESSSYGVQVSDVVGKASNVTGYLSFKVTKNFEDNVNKYVKVNLYNKSDRLVLTKYILLDDFDNKNEMEYQIKLRGHEIRKYYISVIDEKMLPDKSNTIDILGWEFDVSNVFGIDLSDFKIFGHRLPEIFKSTEIINKNNIKSGASGVWNWAVSFAKSVPWWGYALGGGIIFWYMPARFLFGIFPF